MSEWEVGLRISEHALTHLCLASHKMDIGKLCRPRSDATKRGVWSGSTLFALTRGISIYYCTNRNSPDTPSIGNGSVQRVKVVEYTRHKWVKFIDLKASYKTQLATTLSTLGKIFSRRHFEIFLLFFHRRQIAWKSKLIFWKKKKKKINK